ncbi:MAG: hydrolase 2, exosortase A system-associated [Rhodocyclaceae bacterium]|nr:hydrolase 2, exosortase A system-associated [Rhodocyclaceae bacterium]
MKAFFLPVDDGRRFCVYHGAGESPRGAFVYVHPFAEEMNLSRRMAALQARALAAAGHAVLQIDLFGCGDSDGDFGEADWETWIRDVAAAADWLREETGQEVALWGLRAGCLLAVEAARAMRVPPRRFLFWQPVLSGETCWRQFMRLQLTAGLVAGQVADAGAQCRDDEGRPIEVAGYRLSSGLADGLRAARFDLPTTDGEIVCVEAGGSGESLSPGLAAGIEAWRQAGWRIRSAAVKGDAFWLIPETGDCDALLAATADLLGGKAS